MFYRHLILLVSLLFVVTFSQETNSILIKGIVKSQDGEPLIGANVKFIDTTTTLILGDRTDINGQYEVEFTKAGIYKLEISYIGYTPLKQDVKIKESGDDYNYTLSGGAIRSKTIQVVADRAKFRQTPVAYSQMSKEEIELKAGVDDIPLVMNQAPGVHATRNGNGFGGSRMSIRGFKERNLAVLINGVPVNDMENGRLYWSNWLGIGDVTSSQQIQRGLGASKLSNPSVGGTMSLITDAAQRKTGVTYKSQFQFYDPTFFTNQSLNNSSGDLVYQRPFLDAVIDNRIIVNTGLIDKLAMTFAFSRKIGEGVTDATWVDAYSYYVGISYDLSKEHYLDFYLYGSPQMGGRKSFRMPIAVYDESYARDLGITDGTIDQNILDYGGTNLGRFHNPNWDYWLENPNNSINIENPEKFSSNQGLYDYNLLNGNQIQLFNMPVSDAPRYFNESINFYHKPHATLNWYWQMDENSSLTNVAYLSTGQGGGTRFLGLPIGPRDITGLRALREAIDQNFENNDNLYDKALPRSNQVYAASRNNHFWTGLLTTYDTKLKGNYHIQTGLDIRYYEGEHYREIANMLGGNYYVETIRRVHTDPYDPDYNQFIDTTANDNLQVQWQQLYDDRKAVLEQQYVNDIRIQESDPDYSAAVQSALSDAESDARFYANQIYKRELGDRVDYDYTGKVSWYGGFFQVEKTWKKLTSYLNISSVYQSYVREDRFRTEENRVTDPENFFGYTLKFGSNYNINDYLNVYLNTGYYSRPPFFNAVFTRNNGIVDDARNEKVLGLEGGVGYQSPNRRIQSNLNVYYTRWTDQTRTIFPDRLNDTENYQALINLIGQDALHTGIEWDVYFKPFRSAWFKAAISLGNWEWTSNPILREADDFFVQNSDGTSDGYPLERVYANGLKVGDSPQKMFWASANWYPFNNFKIVLDYKFNWDYYTDFNPEALVPYVYDPVTESEKENFSIPQPWKLPAYWWMNLYVQYTIKDIIDESDLRLSFRVYNMTDNVYISDAFFRNAVSDVNNNDQSDTNGLFDNPDEAEVHFGYPRSYTFSLQIQL